MGISLLLMLLFPGVCGLSSSVPRHFHVVKKGRTWAAAQQYCREEFTDLATIDNMADMEEIKRVIQEAGVGEGWRVWIGLKYDESTKWQWSLADEGFYGENEAEFRNWDTDAGQPDSNAVDGCVCIHEEGKWHDQPFYVTHHFICYNGTNSTPPYVLVDEEKTWVDAQRYCRDHYTDLASVRNQAENNKITGLLTGGDGYVWIGLFRDAWEWSDGSNSSFRHWAPREPNNDYNLNELCVEMWTSGLWNDAPCDHPKYFVCYEAPPQAIVVVVSPPLPFYSGDEVTLSCDIPDYSDWLRYVWLKDNTPVPGETNQTITITLPLEAGRYQCSGEREDRPMTSSVSKSVNIMNSAPPNATVVVVSPPLPFYSGDVVTLSCDIPDYSLHWLRYVWLKDNSTVPGEINQTITITLPLEAGQYQCSGERQDRPMTSSVSSSVDIIISNAHVKRTQMVRVEMEAADDVDMEDPDVQKAFLKQIGDRLKAEGFRGNVKLSWEKQPDGKVFHKKKSDKKKKKRDEL